MSDTSITSRYDATRHHAYQVRHTVDTEYIERAQTLSLDPKAIHAFATELGDEATRVRADVGTHRAFDPLEALERKMGAMHDAARTGWVTPDAAEGFKADVVAGLRELRGNMQLLLRRG